MNLLKLKYFQSVCVNKSVSNAAEKLHVSQPSLSSAIKDLENEFGVALFCRHQKGMSLTDEGEILLQLTNNLLTHAEQVERTMCDLGIGKKVLRLGVPPMIGSFLLPIIYKDFAPKHPEIQLEITESGRLELNKLLQADRLDMVIIPHVTPVENTHKAIEITQFEIVCCTHKDSEICKIKEVTPKDLKEQNVVLFKDSFFQTEQIKNWFTSERIEPKILLQTDQLSTLINIVEKGHAIGFMFKQLIKENKNLVTVPMQQPMNICASLVWKREKSFKAITLFADFIATVKI